MDNVYGYDFTDGKEVEITDPFVCGKLSNNSHFDVIAVDNRVVEPTVTTTEPEEILVIDTEDNDINCDYGVFRVKEDGTNYARPDQVFETMEECTTYIAEKDFDPESRVILKREKTDV